MSEDKYMEIIEKMRCLSFDFYKTWAEAIEEMYEDMTGWITHSEDRKSVDFLTEYGLRTKKIDSFINSGYADLMSMECNLDLLHDIAEVKKDYGKCDEFFKLIMGQNSVGSDYNDDLDNLLNVYNDALYSIYCANEYLKHELRQTP